MTVKNDIIYKDNLPIHSKLAYAGANTTNGILSGLAFSSLTFFYNIKFGLDSELIGIAWLIFAFWNALNDPLFGFIEDKTKSRLGRRIPYIRYGSVIYGVLFIFCWYPFADPSSQMGLFLNFLLMLVSFDTLFTIIGIVTYILPAEMTITAEGRSNLMVYSTVFGAIGTIVTQLLPTFLLLGGEPEVLNPLFRPIMIIIAILCSAILYISSYYLKENQYTQNEETLGFLEGIKETIKNKPFLIFEASKYMYVLCSTILTSGLLYYIQFVLKLGDSPIASLTPLICVFGVGLLFTFVYNAFVPKYGLKKIFLFGSLWSAGAFLLTFFLAGRLETGIVGFCLIGVGFSALLITTGAIIADVMDYDEVRTGKRREATYSGMEALITKPAISIANWLFLGVFSLFGFDKDASVQTAEAEFGIMIAIFLIPAILLFMSALIMRFYPLDGKEWNGKKQELAQIHNQKEIAYIKYLQDQKIITNQTDEKRGN